MNRAEFSVVITLPTHNQSAHPISVPLSSAHLATDLYKLHSRLQEEIFNSITVNLESNKLEEIPSEIGRLSELTTLTLKNNRLINIPAEIGQLTKLTELFLDYNQLNEIPATIGDISELTYLSISNNQLKSIPIEIGNLSKLRELYLWIDYTAFSFINHLF